MTSRHYDVVKEHRRRQ